jgi:hypothetical protein
VISARIGLRHIGAGLDVVNAAEMPGEAELLQHPLGVTLGRVGEDELAARQRRDRRAEPLVACQVREVELVHVVEERLGRQPVLVHQAAQGGAVGGEEALAQGDGAFEVDLQLGHDERVHALLDLGIDGRGRGVERVVEIEDPGLDLAERPPAARHR